MSLLKSINKAIEEKNASGLREIFKSGKKVEASRHIQFAACVSNNDVVKVLLENKADPNFSRDKDMGALPLTEAFINRDFAERVKIIKTLLKFGADPNFRVPGGRPPYLTPVESLKEEFFDAQDEEELENLKVIKTLFLGTKLGNKKPRTKSLKRKKNLSKKSK